MNHIKLWRFLTFRGGSASKSLVCCIEICEETDLYPINVEIRDELAYCHNVEAELDGKLRFHDIKMFLKYGSYPDSGNCTDKRTLRNYLAVSS